MHLLIQLAPIYFRVTNNFVSSSLKEIAPLALLCYLLDQCMIEDQFKKSVVNSASEDPTYASINVY